MYSGVLLSNMCFAHCRADPFFIRKLVGNQRQSDLKTSKILSNRLQIRTKIVQGTYWRPSGAPWGAQGVPDWILGVKSWFVGPPLDPQMGSIFRLIFNVKCIIFLFDFWMYFWTIWHPCWTPKCIQNGVRNGKRVFLILSASCRRELDLGGFGTPKSIKMTSVVGA